jgi:UDP-N-acetylglucosamine acyltransferase
LNLGGAASYTRRVVTAAAIHPTAIVDPNAALAAGVVVGPFCVVESGVRIGADTILGAHVHLRSGTTLGANCRVHTGAVIGDSPQVTAGAPRESFVVIGDRCIIREGVTIHRSMKEGATTRLGNDCFLMVNSHVAHDCVLGNNVILVNGALLAGHVQLDDSVIISGNTVVHQFCRVGKLALVSGVSGVVKDVPPFVIASGPRARIRALNIVGIRRADIPPQRRQLLKRAFHVLYRQGLNISQALAALEKMEPSPELKTLVDFIRCSKRGISAASEATETLDAD